MKKKILLIDDSVTIHRVIDLCVDKDKYDVAKVFSKDEAVPALKQEMPDLVLLDNKLADIKTFDMVQKIKDACPGCYVVLLAGAFDQFDKEQCDETGADDFIYKPFDAKTLDAKILCGLEGICDEQAQKEISLSEDEMQSILPELSEDVEIPDFEDVEAVKAPEEEELTLEGMDKISFEGLDEAEETHHDGHPAEEEVAVSQADEDEEDAFSDFKFEPKTVKAEEQIDDIELKLDEPSDGGDMSNPFDGLVEADEESFKNKDEKPEEEPQPVVEPVEEEDLAPDEQDGDELDNLLNDINDENAVNVDLPLIEEEIGEEAESGEIPEIDLGAAPEEALVPEPEADSQTFEITLDEPEEEPEAELPVMSFPEEPESAEEPAVPEEAGAETAVDIDMPEEADAVEADADDTDADDTDTGESESLMETEPEPVPSVLEEVVEEDEKPVQTSAKPVIKISEEKLVEAVYEAIDEDTLKYAIKEVLTDKISRILEDELPYLVEKAIRKEIERLVKAR